MRGIVVAGTAAAGWPRYTPRPTNNQPDPEIPMGRGDKRSRKGKIWRGSFGNSRPTEKNARAKQAAAKKG